MLNDPNKSPSRAIQILVLLGFSMAGLIATSVVVLLVPSLRNAAVDNADAGTLMIVQTIQSLLAFLIPPFLTIKVFNGKPSNFMALNRRTSWFALSVVVAVFVLSMPALNWLVDWNEHIELPASMKGIEASLKKAEEAAQASTKVLLSGTSWMSLVASLLVVGILPGLCEEMFFRGGLLRMSSPSWKENHLMVWMIAFVFSAFHLQFYGLIPRIVLGLWMGYLLLWTRSLWVPVIAHALNNSTVVVFTFIANRGVIEDDALNHFGLAENGQIPWLALSSAIVTLAVVLLARKKFLKKFDTK